jgi:hypothetical protein
MQGEPVRDRTNLLTRPHLGTAGRRSDNAKPYTTCRATENRWDGARRGTIGPNPRRWWLRYLWLGAKAKRSSSRRVGQLDVAKLPRLVEVASDGA